MTTADRVRWLRLAGWSLIILGVLLAIYILRQVLAPFLLALALAYVLDPPVRALHREGISRAGAILLIYALLGLAGAAVAVFLLPNFLQELGRLTDQIPRYTAHLSDLARGWQQRYDAVPLPEGVRSALDQSIDGLERRLLSLVTRTVEALLGLASTAWALVLAPFLAFYMLKDTEQFRRALLDRVPLRSQSRWRRLVHDCDRVLSGFIRGQVIIALLVGALVGATAALLGLPFAILLGLLAGLGEFVPYFGPIIGSLPAVLLAGAQSTQTLLQLVMALIIIHQLEQAVLMPLILGDRVGLHPLLVVFVLLAAGQWLGLAGMIVAVPLAGIVRSLWRFAVVSAEGAPVPPGPVPGGRTPGAAGDGSVQGLAGGSLSTPPVRAEARIRDDPGAAGNGQVRPKGQRQEAKRGQEAERGSEGAGAFQREGLDGP